MNNHAWLYLSILIMVSTCVLVEGSSLRLVGGTFPWEGRVEMISPRAGTVCDDSWSINDAKVICRMLGYLSTQYNPVARSNAYYGEGAGSIVLDDVGCSGSETDILMCSHRNISNCIHAEDAGVNCFHGRVACPACTCNCPDVSLPDLTCPAGVCNCPNVSLPDLTCPAGICSCPNVSLPDLTCPAGICNCPNISMPDLTCPNLTIPEVVCPSSIYQEQFSNITEGTSRLMYTITLGGLGLNIVLSLVIVFITCQTKDKTSKTLLDSSSETNQACTDLTETRYEELQDRGRSTATIEKPDESLYANMAGL